MDGGRQLRDVRVPAGARIGGSEDIRIPRRDDLAGTRPSHIAALAVGIGATRSERQSRMPPLQRRAGRRSGISNWCRRCSPTSRPGCLPGAHWSATPRGSGHRRRPWDCAVGGEVVLHRNGRQGRRSRGPGSRRQRLYARGPVERIYRDVRLLRLYEGTSEIQRLIIGADLVRAAQNDRRDDGHEVAYQRGGQGSGPRAWGSDG